MLAIGGFGGGTPVVTIPAFVAMVERNDVRFALIYRVQPSLVRQSRMAEWIREHGAPVDPALWRDEPNRPGATVMQTRAERGLARAMELYDLRKPAIGTGSPPELAAP